MKLTNKVLSLAIASAGLLTLGGCGGGSSSITTAGTTTPVTVTPSLGQFSDGTAVQLTKSDGTVLASGSLVGGSVTLNLPDSHSDAVVAEVLYKATDSYYDESRNSRPTFAKSGKLRAVMSSKRAKTGKVGVTALTHAAVANLEATTGVILGSPGAVITTAHIDDANTKIAISSGASSIGLTDILDAPTLVNNTSSNLGAVSSGDKYALLLAGFASTATGTTIDAADAFASDMRDGKRDGKDGGTAVAGYNSSAKALEDGYKNAASTFAPTVVAVVNNKPLVTQVDVSAVTSTATAPTALALTKAMFAELRTTLNFFSNTAGTGWLDKQVTRANDDLTANVAPDLNRVSDRVSALSSAIQALEDLTNGHPRGLSFQQGTDPLGNLVLKRGTGSAFAAWFGFGSLENCWTDNLSANAVTKVTCANAGTTSADWNKSHLKLMVYAVTKTANVTNSYNYTASRYNLPVQTTGAYTINNQTLQASVFNPIFNNPINTPTLVQTDSASNPMPVGSGTAVKTVTGTGQSAITSSMALNGTFPPSGGATNTSILETTADTVALNVVRGAQTGTVVHYDLTGSVQTKKLADQTLVVNMALNSGSYVEVDESNANNQGSVGTAAVLVGSAQTVATKFAGTLTLGAFAKDKYGNNRQPTSVVFDGGISDTSTGGAGQILTGKLTATVSNYSQIDSIPLETANNYRQNALNFTGTVQAPGRPWLKLIVASNRTGLNTAAVTVDYSYGAVSLTTSTTTDSTVATMAPITMSNQDGIQLTLDANNNGSASKGGAKQADVLNGAINYVDGVTESVN